MGLKSDPTFKEPRAMPNSQWYPCNRYVINNVKDIIVFLCKELFSQFPSWFVLQEYR